MKRYKIYIRVEFPKFFSAVSINSFKNSWPVPSDHNLFDYRFGDTTSKKMEYNLLSK